MDGQHGTTGLLVNERLADLVFLCLSDEAECLVDNAFDVQGSNDTNYLDLFIYGNDEQIQVLSRLDNLGKGASGAAIQNMNILLGMDETTGLL